jgi:hypothetical protein
LRAYAAQFSETEFARQMNLILFDKCGNTCNLR